MSTKTIDGQSVSVAADTDLCQFLGCERPVRHDETSRYCRWCQEAFGSAGVLDRDVAELLAGSRYVSVHCQECGQSRTCALTQRGWQCQDCQQF